MFLLQRISKTPNSPLKVAVDQKAADDPDAGLGVGGIYYFSPAGEDGDTHQVSEHAARAIMGDPGLQVHFTCTPALDRPEPAAADLVEPAAAEPARTPRARRSGTRKP